MRLIHDVLKRVQDESEEDQHQKKNRSMKKGKENRRIHRNMNLTSSNSVTDTENPNDDEIAEQDTTNPIKVKLHQSIFDGRTIELMNINDVYKLREYDRTRVFKSKYPSKEFTFEHINNIQQLLEEYGQVNPCIIGCWPGEHNYTSWQGVLKEGCHRIIAAKNLGWTHIAVHFVVRSQWIEHPRAKNFPKSFDNRTIPRLYPSGFEFGLHIRNPKDAKLVKKKLPSHQQMRKADGWSGI